MTQQGIPCVEILAQRKRMQKNLRLRDAFVEICMSMIPKEAPQPF